jgi:hypothetical protein
MDQGASQEWCYNSEDKTIYHHTNRQWEQRQAKNIGRLRFFKESTPCDNPTRFTHIIDIKLRATYIEIVHQDEVAHYVEAQPTPLNTYISGIGNCIHALPKHVQRLFGNIPK